MIARGIFTYVPDLASKLRRYINAYSSHARRIRWKYSEPTRRFRTNEFTATRHWCGRIAVEKTATGVLRVVRRACGTFFCADVKN